MSGISSFNLFFHVIKRQRGGLDGSVIFSPSVSRVDVGYFKLASFPVIKRQRGGSDRAVIFPPGVSRVDIGISSFNLFPPVIKRRRGGSARSWLVLQKSLREFCVPGSSGFSLLVFQSKRRRRGSGSPCGCVGFRGRGIQAGACGQFRQNGGRVAQNFTLMLPPTRLYISQTGLRARTPSPIG
jgi:hypothetical protein